MNISDIITLIGAVGGCQGLAEGLRWWLARKASARAGEAEAVAAENTNIREQTDWLERRLQQRDEKVDSLYAELRKVQNDLLEQVHANHELAMQLKDAEIRKCSRHGCKDRVPPSEF